MINYINKIYKNNNKFKNSVSFKYKLIILIKKNLFGYANKKRNKEDRNKGKKFTNFKM